MPWALYAIRPESTQDQIFLMYPNCLKFLIVNCALPPLALSKETTVTMITKGQRNPSFSFPSWNNPKKKGGDDLSRMLKTLELQDPSFRPPSNASEPISISYKLDAASAPPNKTIPTNMANPPTTYKARASSVFSDDPW